jgi:hypothetical protein
VDTFRNKIAALNKANKMLQTELAKSLKDSDKGHLFALIDAYLRDAKARLAYGS